MYRIPTLSAATWLVFLAASPQLKAQLPCDEKVTSSIHIDSGHPWRPPFGLDRVGKPITVVVDLSAPTRPLQEYYLAGFRSGHELERHVLNLSQTKDTFTATTSLGQYPDEVVLSAKCRYQGEATELRPVSSQTAKQWKPTRLPRPDKLISPRRPRHDSTPGGLAALSCRAEDDRRSRGDFIRPGDAGLPVKAWFESSKKPVEGNTETRTAYAPGR